MSPKKNLHLKNTKNKIIKKDPETEEETEETEELDGPKAKKSVDIEAALEPASIIDEKIDEDILIPADDIEDSSEEVSLDDEELNPFGDKWEQ